MPVRAEMLAAGLKLEKSETPAPGICAGPRFTMLKPPTEEVEPYSIVDVGLVAVVPLAPAARVTVALPDTAA